MTTDEFKKLRKYLFSALPDLLEWIRTNSPDIELTLDLWYRVVKDCDYHDCLHVIDDWISGKRPAPKPYERSQTALMLKSSVEFDKAKERERTRELSEHEKVEAMRMEYRRSRDKDYKPLSQHLPSLGVIFREGKKAKDDFLAGKISIEQYESRKKELIDSVQ